MRFFDTTTHIRSVPEAQCRFQSACVAGHSEVNT